MDFVKRPEKRGAVVECFTASTVSLRSTSDPKKMWVKDRLQRRGLSSPIFCNATDVTHEKHTIVVHDNRSCSNTERAPGVRAFGGYVDL
jgi:hypothetical protein